jgi:hypothetical protein
MALSRGWKIALVVIGLVLALSFVLMVFNEGDVVPGSGEGNPPSGLILP